MAQDPAVVSLLKENHLNAQGHGETSLEASLLRNLSLQSQDPGNQELAFQPLSPTAFTPQPNEPPQLAFSEYPITTSSSDVALHHIMARIPSATTRIPPPSLTLQPPTSPPCVQSYDDEFQPLSSPSDILSHYGFSSCLSSPGVASQFSHSASSLSPQPLPTLQPPGSPHGLDQIPPSYYKRHLSWPTSPSQQIMSKFNFLTPPMRSPVAPHRSPLSTSFPLSPRPNSRGPVGSSNAAAIASPVGSDTHRRVSATGTLLPPHSSPRHMLTVPMGSSPCRSPTVFGPSLQPYQQSRSRSPSPISEFFLLFKQYRIPKSLLFGGDVFRDYCQLC